MILVPLVYWEAVNISRIFLRVDVAQTRDPKGLPCNKTLTQEFPKMTCYSMLLQGTFTVQDHLILNTQYFLCYYSLVVLLFLCLSVISHIVITFYCLATIHIYKSRHGRRSRSCRGGLIMNHYYGFFKLFPFALCKIVILFQCTLKDLFLVPVDSNNCNSNSMQKPSIFSIESSNSFRCLCIMLICCV